MMNNIPEFLQHLSDKKKNQTYIDTAKELLNSFYNMLGTNHCSLCLFRKTAGRLPPMRRKMHRG